MVDIIRYVIRKNIVMISSLKRHECHQNCCQKRPDFKVKYPQNSISAGALPKTPLGELTALHQTN